MKKTIVILMTLALVAPAALMAQPGPGAMDRPCDGPAGFAGRDCPMGGGPGFMKHHGGRGMKGHGMRGEGFLAFADEIELTDEQQSQLEDLRVNFRKEGIDKRAELEKAQVDLQTLKRDDDAAESAVLRQIDVVSGLRADLQKMRYSHHQEMKAVLTAQQLDKLDNLRKERRSECRPGRGQGQGPGAKSRR